MGTRFIKLDDKDTVIIGRGRDVDLLIDDDMSSRHHWEVKKKDDREYLVADLKSKNGTYVNGTLVASTTLNHGDVIMIGKAMITFLLTR